MQRILDVEKENTLSKITYLIGNSDVILNMSELPSKIPFDSEVMDFLASLSKGLMHDRASKEYPDVVTFAFWIRTASLEQIKKRLKFQDEYIHVGRGTAFHIAPSNVPINFAYSLVMGLLMGNSNIVRIPSKDFPQVKLIVEAIKKSLIKHEAMKPYIALIRYGRERDINDVLSSLADIRIIWGGDATIEEIRKSPLPPRSTEVTFADRFSLAIIDSDSYMVSDDKKRIAIDFYNDTYLSDQNACTSPRLIVWTGQNKDNAKKEFWENLHVLVKEKYNFQSVMSVNKLTSAYVLATCEKDIKIVPTEDNLLMRIQLSHVTRDIIERRDNSGYFLEYDCDDLMELRELCDDKRIQTVAILGHHEMLLPLIQSGIKGIDRVVPVGKTMDFDLIWDGYNLMERLTRTIFL